jgi:predicted transposase YbfD/YdcC
LPKKTLGIIKSQGNEAIIQIKSNQKVLLNAARDTTQHLEPTSTFSRQEPKKHNRKECRETSVFKISLPLPGEWNDLFKAIIRVRRYTDKFDTKNKKWCLQTEVAYYGATFLLNAEQAASYIRFHWHIENKNHYVRDVSLGEDASRIRKNPGIFARLRSIALNLFRTNNVTNIKRALFENALNFENLLRYHGIF